MDFLHQKSIPPRGDFATSSLPQIGFGTSSSDSRLNSGNCTIPSHNSPRSHKKSPHKSDCVYPTAMRREQSGPVGFIVNGSNSFRIPGDTHENGKHHVGWIGGPHLRLSG